MSAEELDQWLMAMYVGVSDNTIQALEEMLVKFDQVISNTWRLLPYFLPKYFLYAYICI